MQEDGRFNGRLGRTRSVATTRRAIVPTGFFGVEEPGINPSGREGLTVKSVIAA
jgi:hypothetical protein